MLVKHGAPFGDYPDVLGLAERRIVDPLFAHYLGESGAEAIFVAPNEHARAMELLGAPGEAAARTVSPQMR